MMRRKRSLRWLSVLIVCALVIPGSIVLQLGRRMSNVCIDVEPLEDGSMQVKADVMSSIGYVRDVEMKTEGEAVYLDFYRTFGLNQPLGARSAFWLDIPAQAQRIYVWRSHTGQSYRLAYEKDAHGRWMPVKE